ncbi:MAG: hypothetical protein KKE61_20845, partial [Proteobacteria bacterium]|nr:hypothetical protein [Pseudomonadota bacterium]
MKPGRLFSIFLILICCFAMTPAAAVAEENDTSTSASGASNDLLKGLMSILQESIDEFIGNYKGQLG